MSNEIRKDYILDRWVIIASERGKRPTDFSVRPSERSKTETCPFCPGNEKMTPPAFLLYIPSAKGVERDRDSNGERRSDWLVRGIPNLYPALRPREPRSLSADELHEREDGVGEHQVVIESPRHDEHLDRARVEQVRLVVQAYIDRLEALSKWKYVSIFRNHRKEAGASLSHAHSQIIATPIIPKKIANELTASKAYLQSKGSCPYCDILEKERDTDRFICENESFVTLAPWASVYPFEFWLLPKRHQSTMLKLKEGEKGDLARMLRTALGSLAKVLRDPPYTFGFHIAPSAREIEHFHWHLEVYPKLAIQAGFEDSTGIFINVTPPELAAESLRDGLK